ITASEAVRIVNVAAVERRALLQAVEHRRRDGRVALEEGVDPKLAEAGHGHFLFPGPAAGPAAIDQPPINWNVMIDNEGRFLKWCHRAGAGSGRGVDGAEGHRRLKR